jgi:hypothetical protein
MLWGSSYLAAHRPLGCRRRRHHYCLPPLIHEVSNQCRYLGNVAHLEARIPLQAASPRWGAVPPKAVSVLSDTSVRIEGSLGPRRSIA